MKGYHKVLLYAGGYLVVAWAYNNYIATSGGFTLPFDLISKATGQA